jgi:hypothetical protein
MQIYPRRKERPLYHFTLQISLTLLPNPRRKRLQRALDSEGSNINHPGSVGVPIETDESVLSIERPMLIRVVRVVNFASYVVSANTGCDSLERGGKDRVPKGVAEELAKVYRGVVDDDIAVSVLAALVVGELY